MAVALAPAQATKSRSGAAVLTLVANGVRSVAAAGTSTASTVAPLPPRTAVTAATLALPKALSCAITVTFLPLTSPRIVPAVATSW